MSNKKNYQLPLGKGISIFDQSLQIYSEEELCVINDFSNLFYRKCRYENYYMGYFMMKYPTDLIMYHEIIFNFKPDLIVETGTAYGGSSLYFASQCLLMGKGRVVTIDITNNNYSSKNILPNHPLIEYVDGSSTDISNLKRISSIIKQEKIKKILFILDSDHSSIHVLNELNSFSLITEELKDVFIVVEDTNMDNNKDSEFFSNGPHAAVSAFLKSNKSFVRNHNYERFMLTSNPGGFLEKKN